MQRGAEKPSKIVVLFGNNSYKNYQKLVKHPSSVIHPHVEKDSHTNQHSTAYFFDLESKEHQYQFISAHPDMLTHSQRENYEKRIKEAVKDADMVVLCPLSVKSRAKELPNTVADFEKFKTKFGSPTKKTDIVVADPEFAARPVEKNELLEVFLKSCVYHPTQTASRHHAAHFGKSALAEQPKAEAKELGKTIPTSSVLKPLGKREA